ncbi:MAG: CoA protein activase [Desulfitobacteriaceae bacterium]|nr:CoA protein activase [Clostridia bacterium]MDD4345507.1 CoA protein activase [Desulfitobacteriaceae bacterium]MDD4400652.1 CoA protein activase [Desulfitobacteriaceae bacterium]
MKVTFPHMGNVWIIIKTLFEMLNVEVIVPPLTSKKTLDLGTKISPESACLPFKINLGNYIEAAQEGADTIAITGGIGPCRFGYYGELQRQILKDAGYSYEAVILEPPDGSIPGLLKRIRYLAGNHNSWGRIMKTIYFAYQKSVAIDRVEDLIHAARPRLENKPATELLYQKALASLVSVTSYRGLEEVVRSVQQEIAERQAVQNYQSGSGSDPLRIGIVGEIYTILDPFSSADIEKQLGFLGAEVDRSIYLSGWVGKHVFQGLAKGYRSMKSYPRLAKPYLGHFVGGHGQETVGSAVKFAQKGYDGIIQILPLTCMPEIVAAGILPRIQEACNIPVMTLTVDEHTGNAGIQTRLEAFVDLLERSNCLRKKVPKELVSLERMC